MHYLEDPLLAVPKDRNSRKKRRATGLVLWNLLRCWKDAAIGSGEVFIGQPVSHRVMSIVSGQICSEEVIKIVFSFQQFAVSYVWELLESDWRLNQRTKCPSVWIPDPWEVETNHSSRTLHFCSIRIQWLLLAHPNGNIPWTLVRQCGYNHRIPRAYRGKTLSRLMDWPSESW